MALVKPVMEPLEGVDFWEIFFYWIGIRVCGDNRLLSTVGSRPGFLLYYEKVAVEDVGEICSSFRERVSRVGFVVGASPKSSPP